MEITELSSIILPDANLPYNSSEDITLSLTNLNDVATAYVMNKNFYRLLANDKFLVKYNIALIKSDINPYISGVEYKAGTRIYYNVSTDYSSNPNNKLQILVALVDTREKPIGSNIATYYETGDPTELRRQGYHWAQELIVISKDDPQYTNMLARRPLASQPIPMLSSYVKTDFLNVTEDQYDANIDVDYVISSGITKGLGTVLAQNTTWTTDNRLSANTACYSEYYSWYRIYKSGYVEQGGISKPISLTEQWNGNSAKTDIRIAFPIPMKCMSLKYNFNLASNENNFMTKYSSNFGVEALTMYQIIQGRRSSSNYVFPNVIALPNAFPGNKLTRLEHTSFSIYLSNESFDLDNGSVGMDDAALTKISWKAIGILQEN